ncbi:MAG: DNA-protecting protein DprA, partial [Frankia sp.]|nr:DNA-protecting protein DprA [Frankia sp.]
MTSRVGDEERVARAALTRVVESSDVEAIAFVRTHGAVDAWARLRARSGDVPAALRARLAARARAARPEADLALIARLGGRLVCPGDFDWPSALADLERCELGPPIALWMRGPAELAVVGAQLVAIVGTRAPTNYGVHVAGELAVDLAERGWLTVS